MRRLVLLLACLAAVGVVAAPAAEARPVVRCHWTKATKKSKRRRVCVKVKVKAKPKVSAPAPAPAPPPAPAPAPAPVLAPLGPEPGAPAPTAPAATPAAPVARLQVSAREWLLRLSRPSIVAGLATIELVNAGEDGHDLHLRPADGGADLLAIDETQPGGVTDRDVTLAAGRYTLYCSLPGHEAAGMRATLTVG